MTELEVILAVVAASFLITTVVASSLAIEYAYRLKHPELYEGMGTVD